MNIGELVSLVRHLAARLKSGAATGNLALAERPQPSAITAASRETNVVGLVRVAIFRMQTSRSMKTLLIQSLFKK